MLILSKIEFMLFFRILSYLLRDMILFFLFFFDKTNNLAGSCLYEKPFFIGKLICIFHYVDGSSNMD